MKHRCYIATAQGTSAIAGSRLLTDGNIVYVYDGDELTGVFRMSEVKEIYKMEEEGETNRER